MRRSKIYFFLIPLFYFQIIIGQNSSFSINILGTIQDGGSPHIGCNKKCCKLLSQEEKNKRLVSSLGLVDLENDKFFLFDATPDIEKQIRLLNNNFKKELKLEGIFLTHAHIGHYSGLMYLGKEALGAKKVNVFAMQRMSNFLINNGPWSQLVDDQNILIKKMMENKNIILNKNEFILYHNLYDREYDEAGVIDEYLSNALVARAERKTCGHTLLCTNSEQNMTCFVGKQDIRNGQSSQSLTEPALAEGRCFPAGHMTQAVRLLLEYFPGRHGRHSTVPSLEATSPTGQVMQSV